MSDNKNHEANLQLAAGDHLGPYRIERTLGSGGMAEVYYAVHEGLERPAALKVLRASLATDEVHLQRFMQEARAAAALVHPNIVQVYDVGRAGEHRYIAQEYVPGANLRQYLKLDQPANDSSQPEQVVAEMAVSVPQRPTADQEQTTEGLASIANDELADDQTQPRPSPLDRQLPLTEALSILLQVLAALTKSANSGVVHRDIKPENIMLTPEGDVKVADFGLARILLGDDPQLTRAGTTLGTPMYMSPEQIQEGQVDIRSDLYSLGATTYHMLAGTPPYTGETPLALAMKHVHSSVPDLVHLRNDLPESIYQLLSRLLAKSPEERFAHPAEVLAFLQAERTGDLAQYWPQTAVPFPGVVSSETAGPMQATLELQSKLRRMQRQHRRRLLGQLGLGAGLLTAFLAGLALTFERPFDLSETTSSQVFKGIEKQPTAQQQYQLALLRKDLHPIHKWEAVSHYFDSSQSPTNRMYNGLASLQWAAALQFRGEYREAEEVLQKTIQDPAMEELYVALAHLQLADGACWESFQENKQLVETSIDRAMEIAISLDRDSDRELLASGVQWMHDEVKRRWFAPEESET